MKKIDKYIYSHININKIQNILDLFENYLEFFLIFLIYGRKKLNFFFFTKWRSLLKFKRLYDWYPFYLYIICYKVVLNVFFEHKMKKNARCNTKKIWRICSLKFFYFITKKSKFDIICFWKIIYDSKWTICTFFFKGEF